MGEMGEAHTFDLAVLRAILLGMGSLLRGITFCSISEGLVQRKVMVK